MDSKMVNYKNSGFTLIELMVTICIFSILAALATLSFPTWKENQRTHGAINDLLDDFQNAKLQAITRNITVILKFTPQVDGGSYEIYTDANEDGNFGAGDTYIKQPTLMPENNAIYETDFEGANPPHCLGFNNRGLSWRNQTGGVRIKRIDDSLFYQVSLSIGGAIIPRMSTDDVNWGKITF